MAYLGNNLQVAFPSYRIIDDISSQFNGVLKTFALKVQGFAPEPFPINPQQCLISVNNIVQKPDSTGASGFTLTGTNIVFATAPTNGWSFFGTILAGADYVNVGANFPSGSATVPSVTFDQSTGTGLFLASTNVLGIATSGVQRLTVDSSGRLGIGTSSPGQKLDVADGDISITKNTGGDAAGVTSQSLYIKTQSGNLARLYSISSGSGGPSSFGGDLYIQTKTDNGNLADRVVINRLGSVGIGTTAPSELLSINSSTSNAAVSIRTGGASFNSVVKFNADDTNYAGIGLENTALVMRCSNSSTPTERMRINSGGGVYVNSASAPALGTELFGVAANSSGLTTAAAFANNVNTAPTLFIANSSNTTNTYHVRFASGSGGNTRGEIYYNGSQLVYATSSDYRLKENVEPLARGVDLIKQLRPVSYRWIESQQEDIGFIAHEVQEVFPNAVGGEKDAVDEDGKILPQTYDPSKLVPLLTAALQEAIAKIETLEAKVAALEAS